MYYYWAMFYIYILHSEKDGKLYTGYSPDLKNRIQAHMNGFVFATKSRRPLQLIHYEAFLEESDAKRREMYLKGGNGKKDIEKMLEDYFHKNPWKRNEFIKECEQGKPSNAIICGICNGVGKAATQSFFTKSGQRTSGNIQICLTCKGKGWVLPIEMSSV